MLKQIAWNTFKNTGNIDTMMELIEVEKVIKEEQENALKNIEANDLNNKEYKNNKILE